MNTSHIRYLAASSRNGLKLAQNFGARSLRALRVCLIVVGCGVAAVGCLVTEKNEFPAEEAFPPSIVSAPSARLEGTALDQIIEVNLDDPDAGDIQNREIVLPVIIRDANLSQVLQFEIIVDGNPDSDQLPIRQSGTADGDEPPIEPTGSFERPREFRLPVQELGAAGRCHKIELLVSGGFGSGARFREPVVAGDLAQAVWWVRVTDQSFTTVDMSTCPQ